MSAQVKTEANEKQQHKKNKTENTHRHTTNPTERENWQGLKLNEMKLNAMPCHAIE